MYKLFVEVVLTPILFADKNTGSSVLQLIITQLIIYLIFEIYILVSKIVYSTIRNYLNNSRDTYNQSVSFATNDPARLQLHCSLPDVQLPTPIYYYHLKPNSHLLTHYM